VHDVCPVGQPQVCVVRLQTSPTPASAQCASFIQRTQLLLAGLQCVFIPVVQVESSTQATHVLVAGRHTWFVALPPPLASGKQPGLSRHSTQYIVATLQKGRFIVVHCVSLLQAVTQVCVFRLQAVPPSPQLALDRHRTHVFVAALQYGVAPLQSALDPHWTQVPDLHTGAVIAVQLFAPRHCTHTRIAGSQ